MAPPEAVKALIDESRKNKKIQGAVYFCASLPTAPTTERQHNPVLVPLPHKLRRSDELTTCLIVRDPGHIAANQIQNSDLLRPLFDEVIGVGKLRRRLRGGKAKHGLEDFMNSFNLVFVEDRVASALVEALGLRFYKHAKHLPVVITLGETSTQLDARKIRYQVRRATKSAQLILKPHPLVSIFVGHTKMDADILGDNVEAVHAYCQSKFNQPGSKFFIKTPESLSLPL